MENATYRHQATSTQTPAAVGAILSQEQVDHYLHEAHRLRAERFGLIARGIGRGVRSAVRYIAHALVRWRQRRATYRELAALDDHALQDIGLSRGQIPFVVAELLSTSTHRWPEPKLQSLREPRRVDRVAGNESVRAANHEEPRDVA